MPGMMQKDVDLSSFPLLRIDQIPRHETQTLVESEVQLSALELEDEVASITPFVSKLLAHVRKEIAGRKERDDSKSKLETGVVNDSSDQASVVSASQAASKPLPATSSFISSKRRNLEPVKSERLLPTATPHRHRKQRSTNGKTKPSSGPSQPSFFVAKNIPNTNKPSSFRLRSKQAKASLRARSDAAITRQNEQNQHAQTRQALETMQSRRLK